MAKRTQKKLKKEVKYILAAAGVALLAGVIVLLVSLVPKKETKSEPTTSPYLSDKEVQDILSASDKTEFNMNDFKIPQGEQIIVTTNGGSGNGLIYSSSNEAVVIIDSDGTVTAVGEGIASITVTDGNRSDSIVVEVTADADDPGEIDLPIYSEAVKDDNTSGGNQGGSSQGGSQGSTSQGGNQGGSSQGGSQESTSQGGNQGGNSQGGSQESSSQKETQSAYQPETGTPSTPSGNKDALTSADLYGRLEAFGFSKKVANAFVYEADGVYLGQIILESKCVHIYSKSDSDEYNRAVLEVLKLITPTGYDNVMSIYRNASSDKAVSVDGKKIQIIVGKNDVHKQLIVYN